jgi:hypothetical protein
MCLVGLIVIDSYQTKLSVEEMTLAVDDGSLLRRNLDHYATKGLAR